MNFSLAKIFVLFVALCNVFAVTVETMDEQVNSNNLTVLRLRINNKTDEPIYNTKIKFFVSGESGKPVVDAYDLGGAILDVDSLNGSLWAVTLAVDTLPSGIFPYESGICLGIHNKNWQPRDKSRDPSYIASSSFIVNDRVELNVDGNHLPDAEPLVLFSGMRIFLDEGDSVLIVQSGDTCFLGDNDHFRMLKVESGGVVYFPVGNVYIGDLQLDAGSLVKFEDQSRNTVLYVKGKILWKSRFSYKTGFGFTYDFVARHFKLVYSGIGRVFFDTNWYGTIIAPNAKIILGQTNAKKLYGQFFAGEIVIHQYAQLENVHFEPDQDKIEYVFNERK